MTKTSVWQKPKALADAEAEAAAAKVIADCPWKEHKAPDGRSYYHNRGIGKSVWKVPEELAGARAEAARIRTTITGAVQAAAAPAAASAAAAAAAGPRPTAVLSTSSVPGQAAGGGGGGGEFMYATKDEAKAAFKAMLTALQAPTEGKWDKIAARMEAARDSRFHALKSNGERASCYKDWVRPSLPPSAECPHCTHHIPESRMDHRGIPRNN